MLKHKTSVRRALCLEGFLKCTLEFPSLVMVVLCGKQKKQWLCHLGSAAEEYAEVLKR